MRTLALKGGGTIVEEQVERDEAGMSYTYRIIESPLPVANYESTIAVGHEGGTTIVWTGKFDAKGAPDADAIGVIEGIYQGGLELAGGQGQVLSLPRPPALITFAAPVRVH